MRDGGKYGVQAYRVTFRAADTPHAATNYSGARFSFTQRCTDALSHCARA